MANITAAEVKKLRDATGAGMMAAKKALVESDGDFDKAAELLRIKGETKVKERGAERTASNGLVAAAEGAMIQLNCETDFVAKNEQFQQLAADIVSHAAKTGTADVSGLLGEKLADGRTVQENIDSVAAVIGEKLELASLTVLGADGGQVASYMHRRSSDLPPQVGVLVEFEGSDLEAARSAAMQIAAMKPQYVTRDEVPADVVENERRIAEATAREEGKPEQALPRIVEGRVNGFFKDVALLEQSSVLDSKKSVKAVLDAAGVTVRRFARFEVGGAG
ncbi:MAG: translation elongation factor Ts [Actinomycetes bacterium]